MHDMKLHTIISDDAKGDGEVNTSLENGGLASVTVNANPGRRCATGTRWLGNCEGTRHGLERALRNENKEWVSASII